MMTLDFQSVAQIVASRGINTMIEGVALAGVSWGVLRCFGARSASPSSAVSSTTRFAVWFSTLLVIAGLPLLGHSSSPLLASKSRVPELTLSSSSAMWLFAAWAVIAAGLLIRLSFSLWHVYRLQRECREIDGGLLTSSAVTALAEVLQQFPRMRQVKLLVSGEVRVPTALGFFRPAVVLPAWALRDLSADELKGIVLHEVAHLRRWDDWTNLAQKVVKALFFFHPAVWWIDSRLALEREIACDDMVLEQTGNARTYAASLISVAEKAVAEKMRMGRALALAQSALGRVREVSQRVAQILATDRPQTTRGWRPALAMIGTLAVITVTAIPYAPELISFQGKVQPVVTAEGSGVSSVQIMPASLRWAGEGTRPYVDNDGNPSASLSTRARQLASPQWTGEGARRSTVKGNGMEKSSEKLPRTRSQPTVIPAKAVLQKKDQKPHVIMAKAKASEQPRLTQTLLVLHSSQFDEPDSTVWTLTVWRVRTADGEQQTLQETIVMSSL
ncbi:MAG: peptidase BlaR1 [Candidatus Angelobacter sp.]|nr:peptidase BlaR1 [Candidatus Angelobacter sp.]